MVPNPGEMFELSKKGKTMGYIQAPTNILTQTATTTLNNYLYYNVSKNDVDIYEPTEFVHGALYNNNSMRCPEKVTITIAGDDKNKTLESTYDVRRGQSILYNQFKT
jgi:hypothetical protein